MRKFLGPLLCTTAGAPLTLSPALRRRPVVPGATAGPTDDVPKSAAGGPGGVPARRIPAHSHTFGHDFDGSGAGPAPLRAGDQPGFRLVPHHTPV
ncbi:hypothetical protein AB0L59_01525 [Streptomyces sp. NPDC052109]|uniref:hypothetical protein n=1 Tax=Streptomyces sp. NPDC052109 TaxID=3155527 RepID=UPI00342C727E